MPDAGLNANKRLLDVLARSGLIPADLLAQIRAQVNKAAGNVDPKSVVKFLVSKGKLTAEQATKLLAEIAAAKSVVPPAAAPPAEADDGLLDLAGFVERPAAKAADKPPPKPARPTPPKPSRSAADDLPPLDASGDPLGGLQPLDDLLGAPLDQLEATAAEAPDPLHIGRSRRHAAWWDTPWLPLGIGAVLGLALTAWITIQLLNRPTGDEELRAAQARYDEKNYAEAQSRYDQFLQDFPRHPDFGQAEVQRDLSALRVLTSVSSPDWSAALAAAEEIAPRVRTESQALELLRMAPAVVEGLAKSLESGGDAARIEAARRALALFAAAPLSRQPVEQLNDARRTIDVAERRLLRGEKLAAARQAIQIAAVAGDVDAALRARRDFLRDFPEPGADAEIAADLAPLAAALIAKVEPSPLKLTPLTAESLPGASALSLTTSTPPTKPTQPGPQRVAFTVDGTVFALDPATGQQQWRRRLGVDSAQQPVVVADAEGGGVIVVDSVRNEVLRLATDTGRLVWRLPIATGGGPDGEPSAAPRLFVAAADGTVVVATSWGDLLNIDSATGKVAGGVRLPQNISAPPAIHAGKKLVLQLADEVFGYVVALADGKCVQAVALGHDAGAAPFAPVWYDGQAAVIENDRAAAARLRFWGLDEKSGQVSSGQELRGESRIMAEPQVAATGATKRLWLSGEAGRNFVVEASGQDAWQWGNDPDSARRGAAVALRRTESVEIVVRRRTGGGITAIAFHPTEGGELWWTELAVPLIGGPIVAGDGTTVRAFNHGGGHGEWKAADVVNGAVRDRPASTPREHLPDTEREWVAASLGPSGALFAPRTGVGPLYSVVTRDGAAHWSSVALAGQLTAPPVSRNNGEQWVCATTAGQLVIVATATAAPLAGEPWRFPTSTNESAAAPLLRPAVTADDEIIVTDGRTKICNVTGGAGPTPRLQTAVAADLAAPLASAPVALERIVMAATEDDHVIVFRLPELKAGPKTALPGRCVLGPDRVDDLIFLATDQDQLLCFNGKEQLRWTLPLADGPLAGPPVSADDLLLLVSLDGRVTPLDRVGKSAGRPLDTGLALTAPPVRFGTYLLLPASDGAIHALPLAAFAKPTGK